MLLCVSVWFCVFLCVSVRFCVFLGVSVCFCVFPCVSVCFCAFLFVSSCVCVSQCVSVCFYLFLCLSVLLSVFVCFCVFTPLVGNPRFWVYVPERPSPRPPPPARTSGRGFWVRMPIGAASRAGPPMWYDTGGYPMLRNNVSGPESWLPGRISSGFWSGTLQHRTHF